MPEVPNPWRAGPNPYQPAFSGPLHWESQNTFPELTEEEVFQEEVTLP